MVPAWQYLELDDAELRDKIPYVLSVDADDVLHRLVVDRVLIRAARRCLEKWHSLQELAGLELAPALPEIGASLSRLRNLHAAPQAAPQGSPEQAESEEASQ